MGHNGMSGIECVTTDTDDPRGGQHAHCPFVSCGHQSHAPPHARRRHTPHTNCRGGSQAPPRPPQTAPAERLGPCRCRSCDQKPREARTCTGRTASCARGGGGVRYGCCGFPKTFGGCFESQCSTFSGGLQGGPLAGPPPKLKPRLPAGDPGLASGSPLRLETDDKRLKPRSGTDRSSGREKRNGNPRRSRFGFIRPKRPKWGLVARF